MMTILEGELLATVINAHRPDSGDVLQANSSARLDFERRRTEFAGWVWCTDADLVSAWVPEAWLEFSGDKCRLLRDYISREIEVSVGDQVRISENVSGWAWVKTEEGNEGWVPLRCLRKA